MTDFHYKDKTGYFGLRVNPSYEEMLNVVRKGSRVAVPDRQATWYANSIYRDFLLKTNRAINEHQQDTLAYQNSEHHLPMEAQRLQEGSQAAKDEAWNKHVVIQNNLDMEVAAHIANEAMIAEKRQEAEATRSYQLAFAGPTTIHPVIDAHSFDLQKQQVEHVVPVPKLQTPKIKWPEAVGNVICAGFPPVKEFPTFEAKNLQQDRRFHATVPSLKANLSYDELRKLT